MESVRDIPGPQPDPETQPFWDACNEGRLMVRQCMACGESHFLPRSICPFCFSADTKWRTASGAGTIYSFSVMRRAEKPYVLAYVTLDEGPTLMTNIATNDFDKVAIGQRVRVAFEMTDSGYRLPVFKPD
jgi:uncharacterized OB-fold protein